jgi:hypothetical protein
MKLSVKLPVMSVFSFGKSFNSISTGKVHFAMKAILASMRSSYALGEQSVAFVRRAILRAKIKVQNNRSHPLVIPVPQHCAQRHDRPRSLSKVPLTMVAGV